MKKINFTKAAAVVLTLALALVIVGLPGIAKADITAISVTPTSGQSTDIAVGGTVQLNVTPTGTTTGTATYTWGATGGGANVSFGSASASGDQITVTGLQAASGIIVTATLVIDGTPTGVTNSIPVNVLPMTISETSKTLVGGDSFTLSVQRTVSAGTLVWSTSEPFGRNRQRRQRQRGRCRYGNHQGYLHLRLQRTGKDMHRDRYADYQPHSGNGQHHNGGRLADLYADRSVWRRYLRFRFRGGMDELQRRCGQHHRELHNARGQPAFGNGNVHRAHHDDKRNNDALGTGARHVLEHDDQDRDHQRSQHPLSHD